MPKGWPFLGMLSWEGTELAVWLLLEGRGCLLKGMLMALMLLMAFWCVVRRGYCG